MAKTFHLDLGPLGFEEQWADLRDPKYMTQRRVEELSATMRDIEGNPKAAEDFLRSQVAAWHVLDGDSGEPLGDPTEADLGGLPLGITSAISQTINELFTATVPNALRKS